MRNECLLFTDNVSDGVVTKVTLFAIDIDRLAIEIEVGRQCIF